MPEAKVDTMCPQCGCTDTVMGPQSRLFTCGEYITTDTDGQFTTSYTCKTIPESVRFYEEALWFSTRALRSMPMTTSTLTVFMALCKAQVPVQITKRSQLSQAKLLENKGLVFKPDPARDDVFCVTPWGQFAHATLKGRL